MLTPEDVMAPSGTLCGYHVEMISSWSHGLLRGSVTVHIDSRSANFAFILALVMPEFNHLEMKFLPDTSSSLDQQLNDVLRITLATEDDLRLRTELIKY